MRGLNSRTLVTLRWLFSCIEEKCPASEQSHLYALPVSTVARKPSALDRHNAPGAGTAAGASAAVHEAAASPASKKNMASMSNSFRRPKPRRLHMEDMEVAANVNAAAVAAAETDLLQQYLVAQVAIAEPTPQAAAADNKSDSSSASAGDNTTTAGGVDASDMVPYYAGHTFYVSGFTTDSEDALVADIEAAGGQMVTETHAGTVDYVIVPMDIFCAAQVPIRGRHMVNEHWVTDCDQQKKCVDIEYYHQPFEWTNEEHQPLAGMVLVLTTYSGSERSFLASVGCIMGADVQEKYVRPQRPLLICPRPEGAKYNGAIKWGFPVVNREWLLTCAKRARKVPMRPFLVGASVAPVDETDDEESQDVQEVVVDDGAVAPSAVLKRGGVIDGSGTDSLQITDMEAPPPPPPKGKEAPASSKRLSLAEKRQRSDDYAVESPQLKHRRLSAIANMARRDSNLVSASQSPQGLDYESSLKSEFFFPNYAIESVNSILLLHGVRLEQLASCETPVREFVFREVMAHHEKETPETKRRNDAISTPELLRATHRDNIGTPALERAMQEYRDEQCLGWVPSPAPATVSDFESGMSAVKGQAISIFHLLSFLFHLQPFEEVQRRFWKKALGDDYISPTQKPNENPRSAAANRPFVSPVGGAAEAPSVTQAEFAAAAPIASSTQVDVHHTPTTSKDDGATASTHVKRLSDFIQRHKGADGKTPTKPAADAAAARAATGGTGGVESQTQHPLGAAAGAGSTEPADAVVWRDPGAHEPTRFRRMMQHRGTPKFNISCVDALRMERIAVAIVRLGGEVCENRNGYDPTCTHVLCEKPSRSEKIFSAIAAGKWLLTLRYVEDSAQADGFLDEEAYEFGNPLARETLSDAATGGGDAAAGGMDETGRAAYRWRKQLQVQRQQLSDEERRAHRTIGVFSAFRVILQTNKKASFRNLLEAGGGIVLDVT